MTANALKARTARASAATADKPKTAASDNATINGHSAMRPATPTPTASKTPTAGLEAVPRP
jgi:hypothetical protein